MTNIAQSTLKHFWKTPGKDITDVAAYYMPHDQENGFIPTEYTQFTEQEESAWPPTYTPSELEQIYYIQYSYTPAVKKLRQGALDAQLTNNVNGVQEIQALLEDLIATMRQEIDTVQTSQIPTSISSQVPCSFCGTFYGDATISGENIHQCPRCYYVQEKQQIKGLMVYQ